MPNGRQLEQPARGSDAVARTLDAGRSTVPPSAPNPSRSAWRPWIWLVPLLGVCLASPIYYIPDLGPTGRAIVYLSAEVAAVIAVVAGVLIRRPARPAAWALIATGMAFIVAGDAAWYWMFLVEQSVPSPSLADALYLAEYPFLLAGAAWLVRGRPDRGIVLDAVLVTVGVAVVIWEFLVRPIIGDPTQTPMEVLVAAAYPVADLALVGLIAGIFLSTGLPSRSLLLLVAGFAVTCAADVVNLRLTLVGTIPDPSPLDASWLVAMGLWAGAALHPSARQLALAMPSDWRRRRVAHLVLLGTAAALVPLTLVGEEAIDGTEDLPLLAIVWTLMIVMVVYRLSGITTEIRRSEDRFRAIFEGSPAGMAVVRGARILMINAAARAIVGSSDEPAVLERPFTDLVEPGERGTLLERVPGPDARPDSTASFETIGLRLDGSTYPLVVHSRPIALGDGPAAATFLFDVSERRAAETTLQASERRYRELFESNPQPMWVYDLETLRLLAVNDLAVRSYGWSREEFAAMTIADIRPQEDVGALMDNIATVRDAVQSSGPWRHRRKDGSTIEVDITSHALTWDGRQARLVLAVDTTERRRLEAQLRQAQKMEAVGRLAGGVAHDFNNLLTAISGYAEVLREGLDADDPRRADVVEILHASERAADLTRQLLAFSRRQVLQPQVLDLNVAVMESRSLLARIIGEDIGISTRLAADLAPVRADPGQVMQVLMNLAVNARDAMPRGGELAIETGNVTLDEGDTRAQAGMRPGAHVMLEVTDTGRGMDAETLGHAFEPFFTTKPLGEGTGLGLATVYGIVAQSGGSIWASSEPDRGTSFRIYLPAVAEVGRPVVADVTRQSDPAAGTETILLVEDEAAVRTFVSRLLERNGYDVLVAELPDRAEALAAGHPGRIDLLVSDVIMPGRNGAALAASVQAIRPDIRTLFMSGYTPDAIVHDGVLDEGVAFIQKPFATARFLAKVREVLDAPPSGAPPRDDPSAPLALT